jgi:NAD(P)-dependent dehydrogenase (short-subunit alcohol dehydrogenase family)
MSLSSKIIVTTGASQGLGNVLSRKVAQEGATVVLIARSTALLKKFQEEILSEKGNALSLACDIRDPRAVKRVVEDVIKKYKRIDILINNAAIWTDDGIEEKAPEKRRSSKQMLGKYVRSHPEEFRQNTQDYQWVYA